LESALVINLEVIRVAMRRIIMEIMKLMSVTVFRGMNYFIGLVKRQLLLAGKDCGLWDFWICMLI
jgi:hypothetical protein